MRCRAVVSQPSVRSRPSAPARRLARGPDPGRQVVLAEHERDLDAGAAVLTQPLGEVNETTCHPAGDIAGVPVDGPAVGVANPQPRGCGGAVPRSAGGPR